MVWRTHLGLYQVRGREPEADRRSPPVVARRVAVPPVGMPAAALVPVDSKLGAIFIDASEDAILSAEWTEGLVGGAVHDASHIPIATPNAPTAMPARNISIASASAPISSLGRLFIPAPSFRRG